MEYKTSDGSGPPDFWAEFYATYETKITPNICILISENALSNHLNV